MQRNNQTTIAVFGGYRHESGDPIYELAEAVGRGIAEAGWVCANGGYTGSMEAASRGAKLAGGRVLGVVCDVFTHAPNKYLDEAAPTPDLYERIRVLLDRSDGFVALPGATGTLAEVAMAWELLAKGFMAPKPLVLLGRFWQPLYDMLVPRPDARAALKGLVRVVETSEEVIDMLKKVVRE